MTTNQPNKQHIDKLANQLLVARDEYYNGTPSMSDDEYDALEGELRKLDADHQVLKKVGAEPVSGWKKVKHETPMGSLDKAQNEDEFQAWVTRHNLANEAFVVTEKLDGLSIEITYLKGSLQQAISRGNGEIGELVTPNVIRMKGVHRVLKEPFTGSMRGEIVLTHADFNQYFKDYKNPRNAAAGTAKRLDGEKCEHLTVMFYDVIGDLNFTTYRDTLDFISSMKLFTPKYIHGQSKTDIQLRMQQVTSQRSTIGYDIDGLVVRIENSKKFEELGQLNLNPRGAVAYKFPSEQKVTTVRDIKWQIGLGGHITPVMEVEDTDIQGVTINNVTLHTAANAKKCQAGPGAKVIITRSNDVIPMIVGVVPGTEKPVKVPTTCPVCSARLGWEGEYLSCVNNNCPNILYSAVKVWCDRLEILNFGPALIQQLIDGGYVKSLPDVYKVNWDKFGDKHGSGIAVRAKESLNQKRAITLSQLIAALNIKGCLTTSRDIVSAGYNTVDKFLTLDYTKLAAIPGIGPIKAAFIADGVRKLETVIRELTKHVTIEEVKMGKLSGTSFVFTGAASRSRKELTEMAEAAGAEVKSSVSKGVSYLVLADPASTSSKAEKARKLGTKLISENEFVKMVENK